MGENVTKSSNCSDLGSLKVANARIGGCFGVLDEDSSVDTDDKVELDEDCRGME